MSNIAVSLKQEIVRVTRKEIRSQLASVQKISIIHRRRISELKKQIESLEKVLKALANGTSSAPVVTEVASQPTRFVAKGVLTLRKRLDLSAMELGQLVGVSSQTIYNWENGGSRSRKAQLAALVSIRGLGKREAKQKLQDAAKR